MIDIKDLHTGAHVEYKGKRFRVIIYGAIICIVHGRDENGEPSVEEQVPYHINPIPISAALLDELGFEPIRKALGRPYEEWYKDICGYPIRVMKGYRNRPGREWRVHIGSWDYDTIGSADVEYLHQLEGIIYLCTGEELIKEE